MNRIDAKFAALRARKEPAFIPFLTAGDPSLEATRHLILEFERQAADLIELGFPFSDPIADGPVIQASYTRALATNVRVAQILDMVTSLRRETQIPIVAMVSYSIVFKHTAEKFIADALAAGIDGATIPDMTAEQETALFRLGERMGFRIACFVAPTTTDHRRELLAQSAQGFIYYIAVAGITGVRDRLPDDMTANLAALRRATDKPIALGFGVSTPQQARIVGQHADGVIVGSAIVRLIEANREKPLPQLVATVGQFVRELAVAAKGRL